MKSKGLFVCDVYNTYFSTGDNHIEERKRFIDNLVNIIIKDKLDILYFSFVTNDTIDYLEEAINDLKYHLPNKIKMVKQYYYNGYINNDVCESYDYKYRYEIIKKLEKEYSVNKLYYADDSLFNHKLVDDRNVIHFINNISGTNYYDCIQKGLNGVNGAIENYLK